MGFVGNDAAGSEAGQQPGAVVMSAASPPVRIKRGDALGIGEGVDGWSILPGERSQSLILAPFPLAAACGWTWNQRGIEHEILVTGSPHGDTKTFLTRRLPPSA